MPDQPHIGPEVPNVILPNHITAQEINPRGLPLNPLQQANQDRLLKALNIVRELYGKPMVVTNGIRRWIEHAAIYSRQGRKPPLGSCHLYETKDLDGDIIPGPCAAVDIYDRDKSLSIWVYDNVPKLKELGLYIEDPHSTFNWVHFQCLPPRSGHTIFVPF